MTFVKVYKVGKFQPMLSMAKHGRERKKQAIIDLIESELRARDVAKRLNISESTVSRI